MRHEPTLTCSSIRKTRRRRPVLSGADLEVAAGESVAIVGENGSGKSTLLNICAGVVRPDAGRVRRPARTGLCPQQPGLVDLLTVDDHVRLTAAGTNDPRAAMTRTRSLLDELGLDAGSRTTAADLSGGQRQKLNLALSLTNDPQLLLLDEPYQGFDHGSYLSLWDMVGRWTREGRSVIVITHLLAETNRVDRVLTLSDGVLR
jgi:ABC-2 type transport system ATP-binding protein